MERTYAVYFTLLQSLSRSLRDERSVDDGHEYEGAEETTVSNIAIGCLKDAGIDRSKTVKGLGSRCTTVYIVLSIMGRIPDKNHRLCLLYNLFIECLCMDVSVCHRKL